MIHLADEGQFQLLEIDEHCVDQELVPRNQVDCKHEQNSIAVEDKPMHNYHLYLRNNKYKMKILKQRKLVNSFMYRTLMTKYTIAECFEIITMKMKTTFCKI